MFRSNKSFEFKFKKSELKCQFSDSNNNIENWNVHFLTQLIMFLIEILILRIQNNISELKCQLSNQISF